MKKRFLSLCIIVFVIFNTTFSAEVYVRFKTNVTLPQPKGGQKKVNAKALPLSSKIMQTYGVASQARSMSFKNNAFLERTFKITVPDSVDVEAFIEDLQAQDHVEMVEKVAECHVFATFNDEFYDSIEGHNLKWHLDMINAEDAIAIGGSGNPDIIVAVVDNAVWGEHEDLNIPPHLQYNTVEDSVGRAYPLGISPSTVQARALSHGTHCAGSIGAINNNGVGIASLSSGVTLMGCGGWSFEYPNAVMNSYEGVIWAAENGARVINCSWGSKVYNTTQAEIIRTCYENGILVVGAAGNDGKTDLFYPGAYYGALSVASVDSDHTLSDFSVRGEWVNIAAPGGHNGSMSIFSTVFAYSELSNEETSPFYHRYYDGMYGTSMASPIVAALAGLMLSKNPSLTPSQLISLMQATAQDKNSLNISPYGGVIDAAAAMEAVVANRKCGNAVRNLTAELIYFDSIKVAWKTPQDGFSVQGYAIYCNDALLDSCYTDTVFYDRDLTTGTAVKKKYTVYPVYQDQEVLQSRMYVDVDVPSFFTLTLSATQGGRVSVSKEDGFPNYKSNTLIVCTATADTGYNFVNWSGSDGLYSTNSRFSLRISANTSLTAHFSKGAAVEEIEVLGNVLKISPNPVGDYIRVSGVEAASFEVLDMNGRRMLSGALSDARIEVSSLKPGTYVLRIQTDTGYISNAKFIKQ